MTQLEARPSLQAHKEFERCLDHLIEDCAFDATPEATDALLTGSGNLIWSVRDGRVSQDKAIERMNALLLAFVRSLEAPLVEGAVRTSMGKAVLAWRELVAQERSAWLATHADLLKTCCRQLQACEELRFHTRGRLRAVVTGLNEPLEKAQDMRFYREQLRAIRQNILTMTNGTESQIVAAIWNELLE